MHQPRWRFNWFVSSWIVCFHDGCSCHWGYYAIFASRCLGCGWLHDGLCQKLLGHCSQSEFNLTCSNVEVWIFLNSFCFSSLSSFLITFFAWQDKEYCTDSCTSYCAQDDRTDGLSGSVSAANGEVGILGGSFGQGTVPKGEDKVSFASMLTKNFQLSSLVSIDKASSHRSLSHHVMPC